MTDTPQAAAEAATLIPDPALTAAPPAEVVKTEEEIWGEIQAGKEKSPAPADAPPSDATGESTGDPAPAPAADPASPATAVPAVDLWANAAPELKAAHEADLAAAAARHRDSALRQTALQRKLDKITKASQAPKPDAGTSTASDAMKSLATDYPEIAQPLEKALDVINGQIDTLTKAQQASLDADRAEVTEMVDAETKRLLDRHPDYATFLKQNGQAFASWVEDQPRRVREAAYRNAKDIFDGDGAIEVLDGFKTHLGHVTAPAPAATPAAAPAPAPQPSLDDRRQRQIAASASPQRSGGRATVSGIPAEGDEDAIWNAIQAQKERARA